MAFAIGDSLLRHPSEVDCAQHRAIGRIDYRRIRRGVTENIDPLVKWTRQ